MTDAISGRNGHASVGPARVQSVRHAREIFVRGWGRLPKFIIEIARHCSRLAPNA